MDIIELLSYGILGLVVVVALALMFALSLKNTELGKQEKRIMNRYFEEQRCQTKN